MNKMLAALCLAAAAILGTAAPASAHGDRIEIWKPYVIEKYCAEPDFSYCKVRMDYAPFQHATLSGPGSYWYQTPYQHYHYGYHHHHHSLSRHMAWCSSHYRTYNPHTDTFVGRGYKRYRCDSPYDGR